MSASSAHRFLAREAVDTILFANSATVQCPLRAQAVWKLLRHEEPAAWKVHVDGSAAIWFWEPATGAEIALMRAA